MKKLLLFSLFFITACAAPGSSDPEVAAWEARAQDISITRDDWGIPHIHGATDADANFGLMYAQAEDDFNRIEVNFLFSQSRLAEAEGVDELWRDLRMKPMSTSTSSSKPSWRRRTASTTGTETRNGPWRPGR